MPDIAKEIKLWVWLFYFLIDLWGTTGINWKKNFFFRCNSFATLSQTYKPPAPKINKQLRGLSSLQTLAKGVREYVEEKISLCQPDNVHVCTGSQRENESLLNLMQRQGTIEPLPMYKNWWVRNVIAGRLWWMFCGAEMKTSFSITAGWPGRIRRMSHEWKAELSFAPGISTKRCLTPRMEWSALWAIGFRTRTITRLYRTAFPIAWKVRILNDTQMISVFFFF